MKLYKFSVSDDVYGIRMRDREQFIFNSVVEGLMCRIRERDKAILSHIDTNPRYYRTPSDSMMDGDEGIVLPALVQFTGKEFERYDIPQFFLRFPRALPVELKGIAV